MEMAVLELERIQEKEMAMTTVMGEGTSSITLGERSIYINMKREGMSLLVFVMFEPNLSLITHCKQTTSYS